MLLNLLATTWRICLFRAGPQDIPAAQQAVFLSVAIALVAQGLQFQLTLPPLPAIAQSVVAVLVVWSFTATVLSLRKMPERTPQTASALLMTNALFSVLLIPFLLPMLPAMEQLAEDPTADIGIPPVSLIATLALSVWSLVVSVWVFRNAMDSRNALAIAAALGLAFMVYVIAGGVGVLLAA